MSKLRFHMHGGTSRPNPSRKPSTNGKPSGSVRGAPHSPQPEPAAFPLGPAQLERQVSQ